MNQLAQVDQIRKIDRILINKKKAIESLEKEIFELEMTRAEISREIVESLIAEDNFRVQKQIALHA
jgi:hypothetical protein